MYSKLAALLTLGALVNAKGYVSLPFVKEVSNGSLPTNSPLHRRAFSGSLSNEVMCYIVSFTLGDGQPQKGIFDTGSSDFWVYSSRTGAPYTYNPSRGQLVSNNFYASYFDGSRAQGGYYKDRVTLDGVTVEAQFGVSEIFDGYPEYGWFGVGPTKLESATNSGGEYPNYPFALKNAGQTETAAYSLYLNRKEANSGVVLFGAVDSGKYTGKLQLIRSQHVDRFTAEFTVLGRTVTGMLDSGTSYTFLPVDVVREFADSIGARWEDNAQSYILRGQPSGRGLTFDFSGTQIVVPSSELLREVAQGIYQLTIRPQGQMSEWVILGDSFLRSAYVVYDLDNNMMAIAQSNWDNSQSNVQAITRAGIPGAYF